MTGAPTTGRAHSSKKPSRSAGGKLGYAPAATRAGRHFPSPPSATRARPSVSPGSLLGKLALAPRRVVASWGDGGLMSEDDIAAWLREVDAGGALSPERVEFLERCLVSAANDLCREEAAAYEAGRAGDGQMKQDTRRFLLPRLDRVRRLLGAVGYPTSAELRPYRLGTSALADARPDEVNLGRDRRIGPKAKPSPL